MVLKALIIGSDPTGHEVTVQTAFEAGGGVNSDIYEISSFNQTVVDYATSNDYDAIIYSYSGEESYFTLANSNPDVMIFMPSDSYSGDLQQLVLTDLLPTSDNAEFTDDTQSSQSESNGYICGQLFSIASQRNCSLQEARICANATKSSSGIIDVASAVAYDGTIQLTVGDISVERTSGLTTTVTLDRIIDATAYEFQNGSKVTTTSLSNSYTLPKYGVHRFRYRGYNSDLTSDWSQIYELKYNSARYLNLR